MDAKHRDNCAVTDPHKPSGRNATKQALGLKLNRVRTENYATRKLKLPVIALRLFQSAKVETRAKLSVMEASELYAVLIWSISNRPCAKASNTVRTVREVIAQFA